MEPWNFGTLEPGTLKGWTWILELVNYTLSQEVLDGYGVLCCNMKQIKLRPFLFDHILKKRQWPPGEEGLMNIERSGICWFLGLILCFYFFGVFPLSFSNKVKTLKGGRTKYLIVKNYLHKIIKDIPPPHQRAGKPRTYPIRDFTVEYVVYKKMGTLRKALGSSQLR